MHCDEREPEIIAYALGELRPDEAADCSSHIETCAQCRSLYESYACITNAIDKAPEANPTMSESRALYQALSQVKLPNEPRNADIPQGLPALIWASVIAFLTVAGLLIVQMLGYIDIASAIWSIGPGSIVGIIELVLFITSFIPIAVMAWRKPHNGMTFRR